MGDTPVPPHQGQGRRSEGREGGKGKGKEGMGKRKENGDRPPTIFGLKVALASRVMCQYRGE